VAAARVRTSKMIGAERGTNLGSLHDISRITISSSSMIRSGPGCETN